MRLAGVGQNVGLGGLPIRSRSLLFRTAEVLFLLS